MASTKKSISNFFVRSEGVSKQSKGLFTYGAYLEDMKHKNHANKTTSIYKMHGNLPSLLENATREAIAIDLKNLAKGGRPVGSYAQSFVFSLPPDLGCPKPTPEQWKKISADVLRCICETLEKKPESFRGYYFSNVHDQVNPHLNVVVSKYIDGENQRKLVQRGLISKLKLVYNDSLLKHCGIDYRDYEPLETNRGKALPKWQYEQEQTIKSHIEDMKSQGNKLAIKLEEVQKISKLTLMLQQQMTKWIMAFSSDDEKQKKRQQNRIEKAVSELSELNIPDDQIQQLDELFDLAEQQTGEKLKTRVRSKFRY